MDDRELTYKIQGCIFEVSRTLGAGFLEAVYQQALLKELTAAGYLQYLNNPSMCTIKEMLLANIEQILL